MPIEVKDNGFHPAVEIDERDRSAGQGVIEVRGEGASVSIARARALLGRLNITIGANSRVVIGANCIIGTLRIVLKRDALLEIGAGTNFNGKCEIFLHEPSAVRIGPRCLFASEVYIATSDMHSVIDVASGKRINAPRDVTIGEHVWVGTRASVLKGADIGAGSVVGLGAVVTKTFPPCSAVAGNPAKLVRSGVSWTGELLPY
jgi:acetyltransferase-like isoleucine patch superfamily enzyme